MEIKFLILFVSLVGCTLGTEPKVEVHEAPGKSVEESASAPPQVTKAEESTSPPQGKSLAEEGIVLYRHDQAAGVYRTEAGDLVRMYRVERINPATAPKRTMPAKRRVPPMMPMKQRDSNSNSEIDSPRQRMFGDWWSNGFGLDPYTTSYGYNYNYGIGLGNYGYSPYGYYNYNNLYPYGDMLGYNGYGCLGGVYC